MIIEYPFDNTSNYKFDNNKLEIINGICQLKQKIYLDETLYISYDSSLDADRGIGDLIAVNYGAKITNKKLDLSTGGIQYHNGTNGMKGCIRFKITPTYSIKPASTQVFFDNHITLNKLKIYHYNNGKLYAEIYDNNGICLSQLSIIFNVLAGQEYEIEFNWDVEIGHYYLFIDGILVGIGNNIGIRNNTNLMGIGTGNYYLDDLQIFSKVQHILKYIPSIYHPYDYYEGEVSITSMSSFRTDKINSLELISTNNIKIILLKDSVKYYYDIVNSIWKISNGSYIQANNILDLDSSVLLNFISNNRDFKWLLIFNSNGKILININNFKINYNFAGDLPIINKTTIYGFYYEKGQPVEGVRIKTHFVSFNAGGGGGSKIQQNKLNYETITDITGYWEIEFRYGLILPKALYWDFNGYKIFTNFIDCDYRPFGDLKKFNKYGNK